MIDTLDHLVLTTRDHDACLFFYHTILGMPIIRFGDNRYAFQCGTQKINIHRAGHEYPPYAQHPTPGSLDLCFLLSCSLEEAMTQLAKHEQTIELGPIERTGARFPIRSIYLRDPDLNLIELSEPLQRT